MVGWALQIRRSFSALQRRQTPYFRQFTHENATNPRLDNYHSALYASTKGRLRGQGMHPLSCNKHTRLCATAKHTRCTSFDHASLLQDLMLQATHGEPTYRQQGMGLAMVRLPMGTKCKLVDSNRKRTSNILNRKISLSKTKNWRGMDTSRGRIRRCMDQQHTVLGTNGQAREFSPREANNAGRDAIGMDASRRKLTYFLFHSLGSTEKTHCPPAIWDDCLLQISAM